MENMLENEQNTAGNISAMNPNKRPTFLTVLCILTWVGCLISLWGGANQILGPSPRENLAKMAATADKLDGKAKEMLDSSLEFISANIDVMEKWTFPIGLISILCTGLCIYGAILMWQLKKPGYYFYLTGEIIPLIFSLIMYFQMVIPSSGLMATMMKVSNIGMAILTIAFIAMYTVNQKHLK